MSALPYMVREFTPEDYPMLEQWRDLRRVKVPLTPLDVLPEIGIMAIRQEDQQPDACAFLILADNARMSILESGGTRPGIGLARARAACAAILCVLKKTAADMGRTYMIAYTWPGVARELRAHGFKQIRSGLIMAAASTTQ